MAASARITGRSRPLPFRSWCRRSGLGWPREARRRYPVGERCVPNDHPENPAGQHDLPVIRRLARELLDQRHAPRQREANRKAEDDSGRERLCPPREPANDDPRQDALTRRADDAAENARADRRVVRSRDERRQSVENPKHAAEHESEYGFAHEALLTVLLRVTAELFTVVRRVNPTGGGRRA